VIVIPTSRPHAESLRQECYDTPRYSNLLEIINSGSDHYPFVVIVWGIYEGSWGVAKG
jgi:hypothetical protein